MKIVVSEIPDDGLDIDEEEEVEAGGEQGTLKVRLNLRVEKSGPEVFLRGEALSKLRLACGRCLKDFETEFSLPVDLAYLPSADLKGRELDAEEMQTGFYSEDEIDLGELAKEQVILNLPMKPLCNEACKGICPICGADLNVGTCGCEVKRFDERFKALEKFLKKGKE